eukprot:1715340-Pleurochrysis_carterae.AAC.4
MAQARLACTDTDQSVYANVQPVRCKQHKPYSDPSAQTERGPLRRGQSWRRAVALAHARLPHTRGCVLCVSPAATA